jgi:hypothetical protein
MIRHSLTVTELRLFEADNPPLGADYDASCLLVWLTATVVEIRLLRGGLSRKLLRELLAWLVDQRIETVQAHRSGGHVLPMAKRQADGTYATNVADLAARFIRPGGSDWVPM